MKKTPSRKQLAALKKGREKRLANLRKSKTKSTSRRTTRRKTNPRKSIGKKKTVRKNTRKTFGKRRSISYIIKAAVEERKGMVDYYWTGSSFVTDRRRAAKFIDRTTVQKIMGRMTELLPRKISYIEAIKA